MKAYIASDVAMIRIAALDEGFREGKAQRDALIEALEAIRDRARGTLTTGKWVVTDDMADDVDDIAVAAIKQATDTK